jgi:hypothetical protein
LFSISSFTITINIVTRPPFSHRVAAPFMVSYWCRWSRVRQEEMERTANNVTGYYNWSGYNWLMYL